ncbi:hypothetical protein H2198_002133 [Neophaeococcomyces mojaviensis]|uniref:Uncharacterized protein n=1 Tax=Neophaeococcomyces mojaviensis TaxID=3383035 RepID=A0ACC3AF57_9EURO|nr:hypothetical protein H2198_002133 [Knufia sp. JES_112]
MNQTTQTLPKVAPEPIPRISIIGAGIAGLALACRLASNIRVSIFEARDQTSIGHSYAITLDKRSWKPLARALRRQNHQSFRQATAVDRLIKGTGQVHRDSSPKSATFQAVDRDVRQWLVQGLIEKGVQIHWSHKLTGIKEASNGRGAELSFENNAKAEADFIIDAGGLQSPAFDHAKPSAIKPKLLPYATYYGTRQYAANTFMDRFGHWFGEGNVIEFAPAKAGEPFIYLQKVHLPGKQSSDHSVELRWLYSRPPRASGNDPLYRPNRAPEEAKDIPPELYTEILQSIKQYYSEGRRDILRQFFTLQDLQNDRILNWHLRLRLPTLDYFVSNATKPSYNITAIGDAAHSFPVVRSRGANIALDDARQYERLLRSYLLGEDDVFRTDPNFYKASEMYATWYGQARDAVQRLREAHSQDLLSEDELGGTVGFSFNMDTLKGVRLAGENGSTFPELSSESEEEVKGSL